MTETSKHLPSITKLLDRAWGSWELRALAGSIWLRMARSGCPWRPRWFDLAALCAPGRPNWLDLAALRAPGRPGWVDLVASDWPIDCPIDTISKKNRFAFRRSCFDAACFVRSGTFLHASNLVSKKFQHFDHPQGISLKPLFTSKCSVEEKNEA